MDNQFQQNQSQNNPNLLLPQGKAKSKYWKFVLGFLGIILAIFVLFILGMWGWQKYRYWQDEKTTQKAEEQIKKWQQEDYERAMADTYGGKTPQETLQMYIEAVEKGDYELASKYFIGDYQEKELKSFDGATEENIKKVIDLLKISIKNDGQYSWDKKSFSIDKPLYVRFKLYPNGIWKIIEI